MNQPITIGGGTRRQAAIHVQNHPDPAGHPWAEWEPAWLLCVIGDGLVFERMDGRLHIFGPYGLACVRLWPDLTDFGPMFFVQPDPVEDLPEKNVWRIW
jgi:hypothetical protein